MGHSGTGKKKPSKGGDGFKGTRKGHRSNAKKKAAQRKHKNRQQRKRNETRD
jgi:hypothetical protein